MSHGEADGQEGSNRWRKTAHRQLYTSVSSDICLHPQLEALSKCQQWKALFLHVRLLQMCLRLALPRCTQSRSLA